MRRTNPGSAISGTTYRRFSAVVVVLAMGVALVDMDGAETLAGVGPDAVASSPERQPTRPQVRLANASSWTVTEPSEAETIDLPNPEGEGGQGDPSSDMAAAPPWGSGNPATNPGRATPEQLRVLINASLARSGSSDNGDFADLGLD